MKQKFIILAPENVDFQLQRVPGMTDIMLFKVDANACTTLHLQQEDESVNNDNDSDTETDEDLDN